MCAQVSIEVPPDILIRTATEADRDSLAQFCRENPGYDVLVTGSPPVEGVWVEDFLTDLPPSDFGWTATHKLIAIRPVMAPGSVLAVMDVSVNMIASGVGHIGLFQVAEALHGTGIAHRLYQALEAWLVSEGMDGFRLGVLEANPRGHAFWSRHGYQFARHRRAPDNSGHVSRVLYKTLSPTSAEQWYKRVPRDDPQSP